MEYISHRSSNNFDGCNEEVIHFFQQSKKKWSKNPLKSFFQQIQKSFLIKLKNFIKKKLFSLMA
jgi:hypothetical protein